MSERKVSLLIVEDDVSFGEVLVRAFEEKSVKVTLVKSAPEAESLAKIKSYDGVLIDCVLPKKNGVDLAVSLREGSMPSTPLYFMSGILKDKSFINDTLKKVDGDGFFTKPFDLTEVIDQILNDLNSSANAEAIPLHSLFSKSFESDRDRRKAIERLEEISGYDLPVVLSVLMRAKSSGEFNIVDKEGEIFGISLAEGYITSVDSRSTNEFLASLLVEKGFILKEDLDQFLQNKPKGKMIDGLLNENLLSPHASIMARLEQMKSEMQSLISDVNIQVNFNASRAKANQVALIGFDQFVPLLSDIIENNIELQHMRDFYQDWTRNPIRWGPNSEGTPQIFYHKFVKDVPQIRERVSEGLTIEELFSALDVDELKLYRAIHLLVLGRFILFDEMKRSSNWSNHVDKLNKIYLDIKAMDPMEIFSYFGVSQDFRKSEIDRVYKEYIKSNHPDTLPPEVPNDHKVIFQKAFELFTDAYEKLSDPDKVLEMKAIKERELLANNLEIDRQAEDYVEMLRKGQADEAYKHLKRVHMEHPTLLTELYLIWASIKINKGYLPTHQSVTILERLNSFSKEEKSGSVYNFVYSLVKSSQGDFAEAKKYLEKSMREDPQFLDARREYAALKARMDKSSKSDTFVNEVSQIVTNFFKGKKAK